LVLAGLAAALCALLARPGTAQAVVITTSIDLDYTYSQDRVGEDINASTLFNQKYEIKYETALTTSHDFMGAVRLDLQDAWYTDEATTSRVAPTLELGVKGSQLAAKLAYEEVKNSTGLFHESGEVTTYSTSLSFDLELTPELWPETKLKLQRRGEYQAEMKESVNRSFELQMRKDIYALRLEYNFKRDGNDNVAPPRTSSTETRWSAKATYKEVFWGGTEFELAYEINEDYKDDKSRGIFTGETTTYTQTLRTRVKNSLLISPRMTVGLSWEYQYDQDLLALDYDYKLRNKYVLELRWDAYDWLKITSEARRETDLAATNVVGKDDDRSVTDAFRAGFDMTSIPWLRISGKAEFRSEGKVPPGSGGSVNRTDEEKYELIAKNVIGDFWDLTLDGTSTIKKTDGWVTNRETRIKSDLRLKLLGWVVTPGYEVSRTNDWDVNIEDPASQEQIRDAKIKFEYQMQILDLFKATFSHEYGVKVDDKLDQVLNFERILQFNENTRLTVAIAEIIRDLKLEGEIDRRASDTEGDPDPELVEVSYALKLDWRIADFSLLSSIKYNDKGDTFDDLSFNTKASWKTDQLELTAEYQFDKIIKDVTEPRDEKRKLNLKLNYRF
jgi:hypothetical protein